MTVSVCTPILVILLIEMGGGGGELYFPHVLFEFSFLCLYNYKKVPDSRQEISRSGLIPLYYDDDDDGDDDDDDDDGDDDDDDYTYLYC